MSIKKDLCFSLNSAILFPSSKSSHSGCFSSFLKRPKKMFTEDSVVYDLATSKS